MRKFKIVGFFGCAKAGKDTYADELQSQLESKGYKVVNLRFAYKVKEISSKIIGCDIKELEDQEYKTKYLDKFECTVRELMIAIGDGYRSFDPDYWVKDLVSRIDDERVVYIIRDGRYPNEAEALKKLNATTCRIVPDYEGYTPIKQNNSKGETALEGYAIDTINNTDKEYMKIYINSIVRNIDDEKLGGKVRDILCNRFTDCTTSCADCLAYNRELIKELIKTIKYEE